jgi:hypothetical protein
MYNTSHSVSILIEYLNACYVTRNERVAALHVMLNRTEWHVADGPVNRCSVAPKWRHERISICYGMKRTASTVFLGRGGERVCVNWLWRLFGYVSTRLSWHFRRCAEASLLLKVPVAWTWQDIHRRRVLRDTVTNTIIVFPEFHAVKSEFEIWGVTNAWLTVIFAQTK